MAKLTFLICCGLLISFSSFADQSIPPSVSLPNDANSIRPISGEIYLTTEMCPKDAVCVTNGTRIHLKFMMHGCVDEFGVFEWNFDSDSNHLVIMATNVHRELSKNIVCLEQNIKYKTIDLIGHYPKMIHVTYLGTNTVSDIQLPVVQN